jgi:hypothetical protein
MARRTGLLLGAVAGMSLLILAAGCGSAALTNTPATKAPPPTATSTTGALPGAITKLTLISQDGCQTAPADQVYPDCDRFLAELRSAVGTLRSGAASLPNGPMIAQTSAALLADADAFDRDGCGSRPGAAGPPSESACVADLERVRTGLHTLLGLTQHGPGG